MSRSILLTLMFFSVLSSLRAQDPPGCYPPYAEPPWIHAYNVVSIQLCSNIPSTYHAETIVAIYFRCIPVIGSEGEYTIEFWGCTSEGGDICYYNTGDGGPARVDLVTYNTPDCGEPLTLCEVLDLQMSMGGNLPGALQQYWIDECSGTPDPTPTPEPTPEPSPTPEGDPTPVPDPNSYEASLRQELDQTLSDLTDQLEDLEIQDQVSDQILGPLETFGFNFSSELLASGSMPEILAIANALSGFDVSAAPFTINVLGMNISVGAPPALADAVKLILSVFFAFITGASIVGQLNRLLGGGK